MDDLFGHVPQKRDLFPGPVRVMAPIQHTPETIRARMIAILAEARSANVLPWSPRELRGHTALFPYMAEWLDEQEGRRLLLDLKIELERLAAPVEQTGPNWQKLWGLAA